jgi:hypothetical protein
MTSHVLDGRSTEALITGSPRERHPVATFTFSSATIWTKGDAFMGGFRYIRLSAGPDGHSCFDEVELAFDRQLEAPPAQPAALAALGPASDVSVMRADRDWGGDAWHPAPARQLLTVLAGGWSVTASNGDTRTFGVGEALLVEDLTGHGHSSRALFDGSLALVTRLA